MATEIILPEMGEGVIEGMLSKWLVKVGDKVEQYAPIAEVETDKVTTETITEQAGTILELCVPEGETIPVGTTLAYIGQPGEQFTVGSEQSSVNGEQLSVGSEQLSVNSEQSSVGSEQAELQSPISNLQSPQSRRYMGRISPVVGRMAAEHEVDLDWVVGTGRDGRITKRDIQAYLDTKPELAESETQTVSTPPITQSPTPPVTPSPSH
ncbi:MAG: E3 binding domain-containing protein, partial [Methylococcales bacterium]|nr:E3 binding domain-containing protein [Methylococcales bacterium]